MKKIKLINIFKFYFYIFKLVFYLTSLISLGMVIWNYPKGGEASIGATYYSLIPGLPFSYFIESFLQDEFRFEFLGTTQGRILLTLVYIFIGYIFWMNLIPYFLNKFKNMGRFKKDNI